MTRYLPRTGTQPLRWVLLLALSSCLLWLVYHFHNEGHDMDGIRGSNAPTGERTFPGFHIYKNTDRLDEMGLAESCITALTQKVHCTPLLNTFMWRQPGLGRHFKNTTFADEVCDACCDESLASWVDNVSLNCANQTIGDSIPTRYGGTIYTNYNLTCLKDPKTKRYCLDIVNEFTLVDSVKAMPTDEKCSYCYSTLFQMRQASAYGSYTESDKKDLELIHSTCGLTGSTELHDLPYTLEPTPEPVCISNTTYTIQPEDTCDKLAMKYSVASAAIIYGNPTIIANCSDLPPYRNICIPPSCDKLHTIQDDDNCWQLEYNYRLGPGLIRQYNSWLEEDCLNMQDSRELLGSVLCLPIHIDIGEPLTTLPEDQWYAQEVVLPPADSTVAPGTTTKCGRWYLATGPAACVEIEWMSEILAKLLRAVNSSLRTTCNRSEVEGTAYCIRPVHHWDDPAYWTATETTTMSSQAVSTL